MLSYAIAMYLLAGAMSGLLAGLFGIGGGLIVVPLLIFSFTLQKVDPLVITHLAVGTSLATIFFTSISSVRAHRRRVGLDWQLIGQLAVGMGLGVLLGGILAAYLSGSLLQKLIGCFALSVAIQMWFDLRPKQEDSSTGSAKERVWVGGIIGLASALFGIGGGSLTVPYLTWRTQPMTKAVASSSACSIPIAFFGALSYAYHGWVEPGLPAHSLGFVYWPALVGVVAASAITTRYGVRMAHYLPPRVLRRLFALLQFVIAGRFLLFS